MTISGFVQKLSLHRQQSVQFVRGTFDISPKLPQLFKRINENPATESYS